MIKTILVPLDGSEVAEQGLAAACRIAIEAGATLHLVRALPYSALEEGVRLQEVHDLHEARAYLDRVKRDLERQGMTVTNEVLPCEPVRAILFAAEAHDADLISLATHGRSGIQHALLGSVAEAVLRQSTTPVLLIRASAHAAPQAADPYRRILVPLDGTAFAETALSYLQAQAIGRAASLLLLQAILPASQPFMPDVTGYAVPRAFELAERETHDRRVEGETYLEALGTDHLAAGTWHARAVIGDAAEAILDEAGRGGTDLIALATHGRHGWDRLLHGSVTRHLLHRTPVPMLILPGAAAPAWAGVHAEAVQAAPAATRAG